MIGSYTITISVKNSLFIVTMSDFRTIKKKKKKKKKKLAVYFIVLCAYMYINVIKHNLTALTSRTGFEKALGNQLSCGPLLVNMIRFW